MERFEVKKLAVVTEKMLTFISVNLNAASTPLRKIAGSSITDDLRDLDRRLKLVEDRWRR